ncbi:MAG: hypothetical protein NTY23_06050 [Chloroflexi bacterium]|nr:hypothetical protein [Chloroflexota bacterium]
MVATKMRRLAPYLLLFIAFFLLAAGPATIAPRASQAAVATPTPGPRRQTTILVSYVRNDWWLNRWLNNEVVCRLSVDHEGLPTGAEIYTTCGEETFTTWKASRACPAAAEGEDPALCPGLYLQWQAATPDEREVTVDLPEPTVWVSLEGCPSGPPGLACEQVPSLRLTAQEPLPNESILSIQGKYNNVPFSCQGDMCDLPMTLTTERGVAVEFWANSTYGDSSDKYKAQVRLIYSPGHIPEADTWFVDVLSTQWKGAPLASCSQVWETFAPVGGPAEWLTSPREAAALASSEPYAFLAGVLIGQGLVDVSECPSGGLQSGGVADTCGLEKARPLVDEWQNRFDEVILQAAETSGVPAMLMKNLFARESQFWPGIYRTAEEVGLGQLTENGADITLLWNDSFYRQFCPLVLQSTICDRGYANLEAAERATLRGALVSQADAECETCAMGIDLSQVNFSVGVFAETLMASCEQTDRIVRNTTRSLPSIVSTYEDLWRFTLVNYNAGPGCLSEALQEAWRLRKPLVWASVIPYLDPACQGAVDYVEDIAR